eukprot:9076797-Pyramimonas_sp.AAC.1
MVTNSTRAVKRLTAPDLNNLHGRVKVGVPGMFTSPLFTRRVFYTASTFQALRKVFQRGVHSVFAW